MKQLSSRSRTKCLVGISAFWLSLVLSESALAWGSRGHAIVCEASVHALSKSQLKSALLNNITAITHLCNSPDNVWKFGPPEVSSAERPTHFINPEILGVQLEEVPTELAELQKKFLGTPRKDKKDKDELIQDLPQEIGSLWWRADQLHRLSLTEGKDPLLMMSLAGHFIGDASMPLHNSLDYDAKASGHSGLHKSYEIFFLNEQSEDLLVLVAKETRRLLKNRMKSSFLDSKKTLPERMRSLSALSLKDLKAVLEADPIEKKSFDKDTPADRKPMSLPNPKWKKLIIAELSRASALMTSLWQELPDRAKEKLNESRIQKLQIPEFIPPYSSSKSN